MRVCVGVALCGGAQVNLASEGGKGGEMAFQ